MSGTGSVPDISSTVTIDQFLRTAGDDSGAAKNLYDRAVAYLSGHKWVSDVLYGYVGFLAPEVIGVFLLEIVPAEADVDRWLWVVVGDLPPAYVCSDNRTPFEALSAYLSEMQAWVDASVAGGSTEDLIPVNVAPNPENAGQLQTRLDFIRREFLPALS